LTISLSKSKLFCSAAVYANWPTSPEVIVAPLSERSLNTDLWFPCSASHRGTLPSESAWIKWNYC
jgi:hypothetical protein